MLTRAVAAHTLPRVAIAALLTIGLLVPGPTLAAKGNEDRITADAEALISTVSPYESLAVRATMTNLGPGTISHLAFSGRAPDAIFERANGPCSGAGELVSCDIGQFPAGSSVELTFVFKAPSSGSVTFVGSFSGDAGQGQPGGAFDTWGVAAEAIEIDGDPGFFGTWQEAHSGPMPFRSLSSGGQQSTVTADPAAPILDDYLVELRHTGAPVSCTSGDVVGAIPGFGQTLDVSVNGGNSPIDMTLIYTAAALGNTPPSQIDLLHERDGKCVDVPRDCAANAGDPAGCFDLIVEGRGRNQVVTLQVQLPNNGRVKGY